MSIYKTVLLAVDLSEESTIVAQKARELTSTEGQLHIIHVIEPVNFAYGSDIPIDLSSIQNQMEERAREQMVAIGEKYAIDTEKQHISMGRPVMEIHQLAEKIDADLVVVGSHGRHGLALLLGSTANGVLHGAKCDVLAIKVGDD